MTKTTEIGMVIRPLRSVTLPARADGSPRAPRRGVRPRVPSPPDPAPSAHPGVPATNRRRGGSGQTARAHCPGVPDRPRRCLLGRRRCRSHDERTGRDVTRDLEGLRVGRVTGRDWSLTDGGDTTIVLYDVLRPQRGHGGAPGGADRRWPDVSGYAVESRRFTRDNWNYRAQKSVLRHIETAQVYHAVTRIRNHRRS